LSTADLSGDGIHPTTLGYDKMARVWFTALTGRAAPPLPKVPTESPGQLGAHNVFVPSDTVMASGAFAGGAFTAAHLTDGTSKAFVFGDAAQERVSISGFHGPIGRLRLFDTPSYTGRTPHQVTIYASSAKQTSLEPGRYAKIGTFPLPTTGDAYPTPTVPPVHPSQSEPAVRPDAMVSYVDLSGLPLPAGTQSVLLDFSKSGGDGDGLSEIQAFAR
ncbi:MAG: hypothetical protein M3Y28_08130, partial [Armatimonadota bacterium]|nr:hypothetical protein [Armatimonadota bacterium]